MKRTMQLVRGDFVDVLYTVSTNADNQYTGPVQFRILIFKVVDKNTDPGTDISANIKIRPADGLVTNQPVFPPTNSPSVYTLNIVP